jgi:hypothetical protein
MRMTRSIAIFGIAAAAFAAAGCSPTYVTFDAPPGSVLFLNDQPHHLPKQVEVWRPAGNGQANRYNVSMVFVTPQGELRAQGYMEVWGYTESDMDKMVQNICKFDDEQLANLAKGVTLVYKLQTASRQPLLDLTLVRK